MADTLSKNTASWTPIVAHTIAADIVRRDRSEPIFECTARRSRRPDQQLRQFIGLVDHDVVAAACDTVGAPGRVRLALRQPLVERRLRLIHRADVGFLRTLV